jgi:DNA N-6-adenine-methyltransferase (Dam)
MTNPIMTLESATLLYRKFAGSAQPPAIQAMAQIALWGKQQQVEGGKLRLHALQQLGRFLIRHGAGQGRPSKTSADEVLPTLASLGITDHHIGVDAKSVARVLQKDFDTYLAQEDEPTLKGLLRFGEHSRMGQPYGKAVHNAGSTILRTESCPFGVDDNSSVEWFTPPEIFEAMETVFDLDVASPGANVVPWIPARSHLTRSEDGLKQRWRGYVWMNPPYGLRRNPHPKPGGDRVCGVARRQFGIVPEFRATDYRYEVFGNGDLDA